jgi:hypothetical protein
MVADNNHDEIGQLVRQHCQAPSPGEEFAQSLGARAKEELTRVLQERPKAGMPRTRPASPMARRLRRAVLAAAAVAAAIFAAVWLWPGDAAQAWAQVVEAVRTKPWVHGVVTTSDGKHVGEIWFSLRSAVAANRDSSRVVYEDSNSGVRQEYDPKQNEIYRLSSTDVSRKEIRSAQTMFSQLFRGSERLEPNFAGVPIVKQQRRRVTDQGREWIEYTLSLDYGPQRGSIVIRVDAQTLLPASMEFSDAAEPTAQSRPQVRFALDYPEQGPADVYALGVPRSAKLIDRVPKPELARVLDGVKSSRQRFADSYYAIVFETHETDGQSETQWPAAVLSQVWCKGDCWRVEQGFARSRVHVPAEVLAAGAGKMTWWKEHLKDYDFEPSAVCDGKAIYAPKGPRRNEQRTPQNTVWEVWANVNHAEARMRAASFGPAGHYMPELYAYPCGISAPYRDNSVELDPSPSVGPAGALLLKYGYRGSMANAISSCRYWVDPARSYVTLRYELGEPVGPKAGPGARGPDTYVAEGLAQAPSGIWYATVVRRLGAGAPAATQKNASTVIRFFVDFKADMPESLFKPGQLAPPKGPTTPPSRPDVAQNLKQIAAAMHTYHTRHAKFPAAYTADKQGRPLLSWRIALLPLLGQGDLYKQFHLDEPWDSQHNRALISKIPDVYRIPASGPNGPVYTRTEQSGKTCYVVPVGKETVFPGRKAVRFADIRHGCSNTIMALEVDDKHAVIWTKPDDLPFDSADVADCLSKLPPRGLWVVLCDGSIHWIPPEFDWKQLQGAFTRTQGDPIDW